MVEIVRVIEAVFVLKGEALDLPTFRECQGNRGWCLSLHFQNVALRK